MGWRSLTIIILLGILSTPDAFSLCGVTPEDPGCCMDPAVETNCINSAAPGFACSPGCNALWWGTCSCAPTSR